MPQSGIPGVGDDDPFACRQPVVLDDVGHAKGVQRGLDLRARRADVGQGRGGARRRHDLLGEGLAPFQPRRRCRRTEARYAGQAQRVRDTGDQGRLRPDDDKVGPKPLSQGHHRDWVARVGQRLAVGDQADAWVARCGGDGIDLGVGRQSKDQGVLPRAGTPARTITRSSLSTGSSRAEERPTWGLVETREGRR